MENYRRSTGFPGDHAEFYLCRVDKEKSAWFPYLFAIPHEDVCSISQPNAIQGQLIS